MTVKIRLQRFGKKGRPFFRIVAIPKANPRNGKILARLGYYDPYAKKTKIKVDQKLVQEWIAKGAQLSDAVRKLLTT